MIDVDQILRDHATAATAEPAPDAWDRLVARLDEVPPIVVPIDGRPRPRRGALAAAAAVVAVILAAGVVAVARPTDDGAEERPAATEAPSPTPTTEPSVGRPDVDRGTMPDRIAAVADHDGDGLPDLVRIEGFGVMEDFIDEDGNEVTGLRDPEITMLLPGSAVAPETIGSVDLGPDGTVYVGVGDEVRGLDVDSGLDRGPVAGGRAPAVSGDGRLLATIDGDRIRVTDMEERTTTWLDGTGPSADEVTGLALSLDGRTLARQRVRRNDEGKVATTFIDLSDLGDPQGWTTVDPDGGIAHPVFIGDDVLGIGLETDATDDGTDDVHALGVGMADLGTGELQMSVGIPAVDIDATADGRWVIADFGDGLRAYVAVDGWLWDFGTVLQLPGLVDAAW